MTGDAVRIDIIIAALLTLILLPATVVSLAQPPGLEGPMLVVASTLFALLHALSFLAIRHPLWAFTASSAIMLALTFIPVGTANAAVLYPSALAYLLVLGQVASQRGRRISVLALAVGVVGSLIVALLTVGVDDPLWKLGGFLGLAAANAAAWALGLLQRVRRESAEESSRARTERAVVEERERISRDVHDLVAHATTVMIAQAEVARAFLEEDPAVAARALGVVVDTGRDALRGMRVIVTEDAGRAPAADLDAVRALIASARSPQVLVEHDESGDVRDLEPVVALALHHVVREALTNAIRHTLPPVRVTMSWRWEPTALLVTIRDDGGEGSRGDDVGAGIGLIGLAERVRSAGGTLAAGRDGAGWTIRAELPVDADGRAGGAAR